MPFLNVENLKKIEGKREQVSFNGELPPIPVDGGEIRLTGLVGFDLILTNTGDAIAVEGLMEADLKVACSRCLEDFVLKISPEFMETYYDPARLSSGFQDDWIPFSGDSIDITPEASNTILINLPLRFICDVGCQGLCPQCGTNLNKGKCQCEKQDLDPRLAKLKELLISQESGDNSRKSE